MNMQDANKEESYSMYPKTSSPPPPASTNMQIPIYQAPMQMYGYTQAPYLYPTQMPAYSFNMVSQNQPMYHQGNSPHHLPPQGSINGGNTTNNNMSKKKWHSSSVASNNSNNNNGQGANASGSGMNYNKSHAYHHNYSNNHVPMMSSPNNANSASTKKLTNSSNANGSSASSPSFSSYNSSSQYDLYKFDVTKLKNLKENSSNSIQLPLFINTTEAEFAAASAQRYELNLKTLDLYSESLENQTVEKSVAHRHAKGHSIPKPIEESKTEADKEQEDTDDRKPPASKDTHEYQKKIELKKDDIKPEHDEKAIEEPQPATFDAIPDEKEAEETDEEDTSKTSSPTPAAAKSWSAIASDAIKSRQTSNKSASGSTASKTPTSMAAASTPATAAAAAIIAKSHSPLLSKQPQRKDKKYVPPSTKGIEPLGSIALRMCFDPDFITYVLQNKDIENKFPLHSIIPRGIINRANICFMSSVLQVLLYCEPFIDVLNVLSTRNTNSRIGTSSCKLLDACLTMYKQFDKETYETSLESADDNERSTETDAKKPSRSKNFQHSVNAEAVKPDEFYKTLSTIPKFKDLQWGHQEDAEEFLTHLLDQLHEELISAIDGLSDNEIQNMLQSINDEQLKIFFIRNLSRYGKAEFIKNATPKLKELIETHGMINDDSTEENGWHEVSGSSKRGKKTKTAAKRTVEIVPSPISKLFGGQFRSVLDVPNNKESQSITLDPFQTIQLDISDSSVNDLETAFKKFSEYELLPFKSSSGNDVEAKKQTFIDKLPQVLLIQFKRFSFINNVNKDNAMTNYNAYNGRIEKIRKKIKYDHELIIPEESMSSITLKNHTSGADDRIYKLTGVIYHHGVGSDGGHYTADVYHSEHNKWYRIDDVNITELEDDDVLKGGEEASDSRTAYILMYQKKN
ncbi:mRNA-binding ubiquitin-specific protease UBP3 SKDI_05G2310 [Saccharomyces kudriavzevii IFO 1802]|uniref:Ubiquitin carboxyl-terminal hydrolase n=1 Tax=Saccharomyces kudriavzevii (strain ATCC MYA-4449 / AS 2.2408 / CBS 8840 / NBRC 1802 / NCYC 2889) TaxID=226230 RepID=A0AA35JHS6_SACK1|nr:uncharacterized protein SKDI_05G2310 [Saccharomyces kudriavzevii IFO 1802]CAI4060595.1 hypothetical protein SKDI_05G2310 [Saccharomyces kudriavzevii IFO 1802]